MSDGIDADFHELLELAEDLSAAGERIRPFARAAIQFTASNIKRDWKANAFRGEGPTAAYPESITYDTEEKATQIRAEIGPDASRKGGRGFFSEDSHGKVTIPPSHAGRNALEANEEDFFNGLEIAAADAMGSDALPMVFNDE